MSGRLRMRALYESELLSTLPGVTEASSAGGPPPLSNSHLLIGPAKSPQAKVTAEHLGSPGRAGHPCKHPGSFQAAGP
jgi:hypothetical protein